MLTAHYAATVMALYPFAAGLQPQNSKRNSKLSSAHSLWRQALDGDADFLDNMLVC